MLIVSTSYRPDINVVASALRVSVLLGGFGTAIEQGETRPSLTANERLRVEALAGVTALSSVSVGTSR